MILNKDMLFGKLNYQELMIEYDLDYVLVI